MATRDMRRGTLSGAGALSPSGQAGTTVMRRILPLSTVNGGSIAANDIIQVLQLPEDCIVHWVGGEVTTANTSAGSIALSGAGYIYAAAVNGNLSTAGQLVVSAATFPFYNSASSAIEFTLTSGTITLGDGTIRVYAIYTPVGE